MLLLFIITVRGGHECTIFEKCTDMPVSPTALCLGAPRIKRRSTKHMLLSDTSRGFSDTTMRTLTFPRSNLSTIGCAFSIHHQQINYFKVVEHPHLYRGRSICATLHNGILYSQVLTSMPAHQAAAMCVPKRSGAWRSALVPTVSSFACVSFVCRSYAQI